MESKPWEKKEVPWCTVCLCLAVVTCHGCVLYGNMLTSGAFGDIAVSTSGWSGVGLDLSTAFREELDEIMVNVTNMITAALNKTLASSSVIDLLVGLAGQATDAIAAANTTQALLQVRSKKNQLSAQGQDVPDVSAMTGLILGQIDQLLDQLFETVSEALDSLLDTIHPALIQVGAFIIQFGAQVQAMLSSFTVTLDKVQKVFDDVMSGIDGGDPTSFADVFDNTWTLFDYFGQNSVTAEMMTLAANAYGVSGLEGGKSEELVKQYDTDGSGTLQEEEFALAAQDPSVPDMLPVVLRSYSAGLSEISGLIGRSALRDEAAQNTVAYLQYMSSKNLTKIYWIATRLSNASVPHEFTSDVMVNLAFALDDANAIAFRDVGQLVVDAMLYMDMNYTMFCYDQLYNSTYWTSEGYSPPDQPIVIERVTKWIVQSPYSVVSSPTSAAEGAHDVLSGAVLLEDEVLQAMPIVAKQISKQGMRTHVQEKMGQKHERYNQLYQSKTSQKLKLHLLGGSHASDTSQPMSTAEQALATGIPAAPTTLEFCKFLSWNSSQTANRFQGYVFANTATSSNSIDGFAQIIEGMVKKIQSFIEQMTDYSTPAGIADLEEKVMSFAIQGLDDVRAVIQDTLGGAVEDSAETLDSAIDNAIKEAGFTLGEMIGGVLGTPLGEALEPVIEEVLQKLVGETADVSGIAEQLSGLVESSLQDLAGDELGKIIAEQLQKLVDTVLESATDALNDVAAPSLMEMSSNVDMRKHVGSLHAHRSKHNKAKADPKEVAAFKEQLEQAVTLTKRAQQLKIAEKKGEVPDSKALRREIKGMRKKLRMARLPVTSRLASGCRTEALCKTMKSKAQLLATLEEELQEERSTSGALDLTSGVWGTMIQLLTSLEHLMPLAVANLKFARTEVSSLAESLDSIFVLFEENGAPIFEGIASIWKLIWMLYFFFVAPLTSISLFYGFWAGGYFGGPGAPPVDEVEDPEKYAGFCGKLHACCDACCSCIRNFHDTQLCFWSILIILQIFALVLFLISLVFIILAAVQIMINAGCASVYILGDNTICGETLLSLRQFLATFMGEFADDEFGQICNSQSLLTCHMIGDKMFSSGLYCVAGSFLAAILTFQLLIESATLHTRAAERRRLAYMFHEKK